MQLNCARRKCRNHLNHKLFFENFIYDSSNVRSKWIGTNINGIVRWDFRRTKNKHKIFPNFQKIFKTRASILLNQFEDKIAN